MSTDLRVMLPGNFGVSQGLLPIAAGNWVKQFLYARHGHVPPSLTVYMCTACLPNMRAVDLGTIASYFARSKERSSELQQGYNVVMRASCPPSLLRLLPSALRAQVSAARVLLHQSVVKLPGGRHQPVLEPQVCVSILGAAGGGTVIAPPKARGARQHANNCLEQPWLSGIM
jgi:hypothetical protein